VGLPEPACHRNGAPAAAAGALARTGSRSHTTLRALAGARHARVRAQCFQSAGRGGWRLCGGREPGRAQRRAAAGAARGARPAPSRPAYVAGVRGAAPHPPRAAGRRRRRRRRQGRPTRGGPPGGGGLSCRFARLAAPPGPSESALCCTRRADPSSVPGGPLDTVPDLCASARARASTIETGVANCKVR
jgi:hypothetical protein